MDAEEFRRRALAEFETVGRLARHLASRAQDAEDLVQETYVRAFRSSGSYRERGDGLGLRPWLLKILHNAAKDRQSAEQRQRELAEELRNHNGTQVGQAAAGNGNGNGAAEPGAAGELASVDWDGVDERLRAGVAGLTLTLRAPLLLFAAGLHYREIAQVLELPVGTVMSRLHRARTALCSQLAELADELRIAQPGRRRTE